MSAELDKQMGGAQDLMHKAVDHLVHELQKVWDGKSESCRCARCKSSLLWQPYADQSGGQCESISSRTIIIQPWEKSMLGPIEKRDL